MSKFTDWLAKSGSADLARVGKHHTFKKRRDLDEFAITYDTLENPVKAPPELEAQLPALFRMLQQDAARAMPKIEALLEQFPDECHLLNFLTSGLEATGELARAADVAERNYRLHPDYLFARMNHAEFLLKAGRLKEIPSVVGGHFSLKRMYPHRDVFHISEVLSFYSFLGRYHATRGELDEAESILDFLVELEPNHYMTVALDEFLDQLKALEEAAEGGAGWPTVGTEAWAVRPRPKQPRRDKKRKRRH